MGAVARHVVGAVMLGYPVVLGGPGVGGKGQVAVHGRLARCAVLIDVPIMPVGDVGAHCVWVGRYICCGSLNVDDLCPCLTTAAKGCGEKQNDFLLSLAFNSSTNNSSSINCGVASFLAQDVGSEQSFQASGRPCDQITASKRNEFVRNKQ